MAEISTSTGIAIGVSVLSQLLRSGVDIGDIVEGLLADGSLPPERATAIAQRVKAAGEAYANAPRPGRDGGTDGG